MLEIVIRQDSFFIKEQEETPKKRGRSYELLYKIEEVLRRDLPYKAEEESDSYAQLSSLALRIKLQHVAHSLNAILHKKTTGLFSSFFWNHGKGKKLERLYREIVVPKNGFLALPQEIGVEVCKFLDVKSISSVAQLNNTGKQIAHLALIQRAGRYGYAGNTLEGARRYLRSLYIGLEEMARTHLLPPSVTVTKQGKLDMEATIAKWGVQPADIKKYLSLKVYQNLCCCAAHGRTVKALIHLGLDVNIQDAKGRTPLSYAAEYGNIPLIQFLLKARANPEIPSHKGVYPLFYAFFYCSYAVGRRKWRLRSNVEIATLLLNAGANLDHIHSKQMFETPLFTVSFCFRSSSAPLLQLLQESVTSYYPLSKLWR